MKNRLVVVFAAAVAACGYATYSLDLTLKNCAIHETGVTSTAHDDVA